MRVLERRNGFAKVAEKTFYENVSRRIVPRRIKEMVIKMRIEDFRYHLY
jgi:hypothetical protein